MLAIQLHALAASVIVDLEAIGEINTRAVAQSRILRVAADVAEGDRLDRIAARDAVEQHLQVLAAHNPRIEDLEGAVKYRFRKTLSPRARVAQRTGRVE